MPSSGPNSVDNLPILHACPLVKSVNPRVLFILLDPDWLSKNSEGRFFCHSCQYECDPFAVEEEMGLKGSVVSANLGRLSIRAEWCQNNYT